MTSSLWQEASAMAAQAHRGQLRKDGVTPYVSHVFRVAMTVRQLFECDDEVCLALALLHDTIEDTTIDYDDLLEAFGAEVANGVSALSKDKRMREDVREAAYDNAIASADWRVKLVKLADTFDNWCDSTKDRKAKSLEKIYRAIAVAEPAGDTCEPIRRAISLIRAATGM